MRTTYFKSGEWNVVCDVCSEKIKSSDARKRWDGFITCPQCYEERHPQDFVRARQDKITVPFQRPIPPYVFTNTSYLVYVDDGYILSPPNQFYIEEPI